jgi:homoserine kinase type II
MYDLAVIAIDWCQEKDRKLHDDLLQRMLKTYSNIKPVTSDELKFFNSFMVFAALNFWLSRLIGQKENKDRVKEPQEMEDVLKHLIEH